MKDESSPPSEEVASGLGWIDRAKKAKDQAASTASKLKDVSATKIADTVEDFNAALPVLREAGYMLNSVDIGIGIPPKVSATFIASPDVSPENVERVMAEHADKKLTLLLMKSLYQAWQLQMKLKIAGLKPMGLSVEIGLVPNVTVRFA
jgi:hypothetical protein